MRRYLESARHLFKDEEWRRATRWFLLSMLVGVVAGGGAIIFQYCSQSLFNFALGHLAGYHPRLPGGEAAHATTGASEIVPWLLVVLPAVGGLISGFLVFRFAPEAEGHGTDAALDAYHRRAGVIAWKVPIIKTIASIVTLGSGGSGGREGPIAQIGAGFGSLVATRLNLTVAERRVLLAAGMGAGVGAIFRAPLAGALFASEIHYREPEFESEAVIPSAIASITAYCVFSLFYGFEALFTTPTFGFSDPTELLPYATLAFAVSAGALIFIRAFYGLRDFFRSLKIPSTFKPAIGGLATGAFALLLYWAAEDPDTLSVLGFGYGALQGAIDGKVAAGVLLIVAAGKIITTGLTIGSGGSGGVFGPSMVIGGAIGGAVGAAFHDLTPELVPQQGAYVLVGMAGFFAGAAKTPISTIIMVSEMTGNYELLLPSLWVCTICYLVLGKKSGLYENQYQSKIDSPAHRGDFHFDVLEELQVREVLAQPRSEVMTFFPAAHLGEILRQIGTTHQNYFPIVDSEDRLQGVFSLNDIREYMYDEGVWDIAIAADFAITPVYRVTLDDNLAVAMRRFGSHNVDELPVVDPDRPDVLVGQLRRKDVLDAYNRRVWELKRESGRLGPRRDTGPVPRLPGRPKSQIKTNR